MLQSLSISNYVLIRHLEIDLHPGLNIITGETGAGKSILLGAIGLLLGQRADSKSLWNENEKCIIEGTFQIGEYQLQAFFHENDLDYEATCIIRREIAPGGKSRAFVNDTPVTLDLLKSLGATLMDIHSQHDTLLLGSDAYQCKVLDAFAGNSELLEQYSQAYHTWKLHTKQWHEWQTLQKSQQAEADYLQYVYNELHQAQVQPGEQDALEQELEILQNAEDIKLKLNECIHLLDGEQISIITSLKVLQQTLQKLAGFDTELAQLADRSYTALQELKDILSELNKKDSLIEQNPQRLAQVEERLSQLYKLSKKYHLSHADELLTHLLNVEQKLNAIEQATHSAHELEQLMHAAWQQVQDLGQQLHERRKAATTQLSQALVDILKELGMPEARFEIVLENTQPTAYGVDKVVFLFSANKGIAPQELKQVASGGEFSRLMLAIKYIQAGKTALPSIIFDEIDTGISGEVARKVASILDAMASRHQLIAITHTPQIAAAADAHFYVYKDNTGSKTESRIKLLNTAEQETELAQMLSGATPTPTALQNARELRASVKNTV